MIVLAVIALILSAGVTYLAYRLIAPRLQSQQEMTSIVVTTAACPPGTRITEKEVTLTSWPKTTVPVGSFTDLSSVIGRGVVVQMFPNEPVLESKLAPREAGAGMAVAIPDGMRAVSIQVNDVIGVAGFIQPGSRVDLILTGTPTPGMETASKIVMENLQILATGQNVQQDANGKPQNVPVVTLLVTPEQAEIITLAVGDGPIRLALRNPMDLKEVSPPMAPRSVLWGGNMMVAEKTTSKVSVQTKVREGQVVRTTKVAPLTPPPPPPPKITTVELIMGPSKTTSNFQEKQPPVEPNKP
jgi:pilus assembly protein CpaB